MLKIIGQKELEMHIVKFIVITVPGFKSYLCVELDLKMSWLFTW